MQLAGAAAAVAVMTIGGSSRALASPIAAESFDYTNGSALAGQNGGTGWSGGWTAGTGTSPPSVTSPGMSSSTVTTSGLKTSLANSGVPAFRTPSSSPDADGSTVYISFLAQNTSAQNTGYAGLSLISSGNEVLFLGKANGAANWGIDTKGAGVVQSGTSTLNPSLLVYRIDFGAASEHVRLYVNPSDSTEPAAASADVPSKSNFTWDSIRLQAGGGTTADWDEVRIGTTYADVVPEPATAGLLAIAAAGLLARRRRRRR